MERMTLRLTHACFFGQRYGATRLMVIQLESWVGVSSECEVGWVSIVMTLFMTMS